MTRAEYQRARKRMNAIRIGIVIVLTIAAAWAITRIGKEPEEATPETEPPVETVLTVIVEHETVEEPVDEYAGDKEALAKMVWGEARGCSKTEQAAVVWCALNRFDSDDPYYAGCDSIKDIVTQPGQFVGYDHENPVDPEIMELVEDVMTRWLAEDDCIGDVGRVLPPEYLFFTGDGNKNTFRDAYRGGNTWDWSLESPYEEE